MERAEEMVERRMQRQPWRPGGPGRQSTGGGAGSPSPAPGPRRWWSSLSGSGRRDQVGAGGGAGCGSTVRGRPVQFLVLVGIEKRCEERPEGRGGRKEAVEEGFLLAPASQDPVRFDASIWFWWC